MVLLRRDYRFIDRSCWHDEWRPSMGIISVSSWKSNNWTPKIHQKWDVRLKIRLPDDPASPQRIKTISKNRRAMNSKSNREDWETCYDQSKTQEGDPSNAGEVAQCTCTAKEIRESEQLKVRHDSKSVSWESRGGLVPMSRTIFFLDFFWNRTPTWWGATNEEQAVIHGITKSTD